MSNKKITSPDLYSKIRGGHLLGQSTFTINQLEAVFEHVGAQYDKMPTTKSFLDWCRRNGHISRSDVGKYTWAEPGPYAEERPEEVEPLSDQELGEFMNGLADHLAEEAQHEEANELADDHFDYRESMERTSEALDHLNGHLHALGMASVHSAHALQQAFEALRKIVLSDLHIYTTERRIPRKVKKSLKKSLTTPAIRKVILHRNADRWDAYKVLVGM